MLSEGWASVYWALPSGQHPVKMAGTAVGTSVGSLFLSPVCLSLGLLCYVIDVAGVSCQTQQIHGIRRATVETEKNGCSGTCLKSQHSWRMRQEDRKFEHSLGNKRKRKSGWRCSSGHRPQIQSPVPGKNKKEGRDPHSNRLVLIFILCCVL